MKTKLQTIDEYISGFGKETQLLLMQIRGVIKEAAPDSEESIRYGMPAFKINKVHIYMAAYKKHIGMYPMYGLMELDEELKKYRGKNTKDAIHFPYSKPVPLDLITKIIQFKLAQNE